ncbi:MAG: hypothetical protein ACP5GC_07930 [Thiomonas sp.]
MEHTVTLPSGHSLTLEPVRLGQLPAFLRAVQPFAQQLASGQFDVIAALSEHGEKLQAALQIASNQPREWVQALDLDDAVVLAAAVIEVNAGFLTTRLLPAIEQAASRVQPLLTSTPALPTGSST